MLQVARTVQDRAAILAAFGQSESVRFRSRKHIQQESLVKILMRVAETLEGVFTTDEEKVPCPTTVPAASNGDSLQH